MSRLLQDLEQRRLDLVALLRAKGSAELTFANPGPGIPPETPPRIFDRFFRGDPAHSPGPDGCGLGLSIAKWIVSAHNGMIHIDSVPAKPATVTVHLPQWQKNQAA
jgi:signal transduction histidine kinase